MSQLCSYEFLRITHPHFVYEMTMKCNDVAIRNKYYSDNEYMKIKSQIHHSNKCNLALYDQLNFDNRNMVTKSYYQCQTSNSKINDIIFTDSVSPLLLQDNVVTSKNVLEFLN